MAFIRKVLALAILGFACATPGAGVRAQSAAEISFWETVRNSGSAEQIKLYLQTYPEGAFAGLARLKLSELEKSDAAVLKTCDTYAADPLDPPKGDVGVDFETLKTHADAAIAACTKAAAGGDLRYVYQLGRAYLAKGDRLEALRYLAEAGNQGLPIPTYRLALWMSTGAHGIPVSAARALDLFKALAENPAKDAITAAATFQAGYIYYVGTPDVPRNLAEAKTYFERALALGAPEANWGLGMLYAADPSMSADKAIPYLKASLAATDFHSAEARAALADLLIKPALRAETMSQMVAFHDQVMEGLDYLGQQPGTSAKYYNEYLAAVFTLVAKSGPWLIENAWGDAVIQRWWAGKPEGSRIIFRKLLKWSEELLGKFRAGLADRSAALPDQYPAARNAADMKTLQERLTAAIDAGGDIVRLARLIEAQRAAVETNQSITSPAPGLLSATAASACIGDGPHRRTRPRDVEITFHNNCDFAVVLNVNVTFKRRRHADRHISKTVVVAPKAERTLRFDRDDDARGYAATFDACMSEFGAVTIKDAKDAQGRYTCEGATMSRYARGGDFRQIAHATDAFKKFIEAGGKIIAAK